MTEPPWMQTLDQGVFTGVVHAGAHHARAAPGGQLLQLPDQLLAPGQSATLYSFKASQMADGTILLARQPDSQWFLHEPITIQAYQHMKEICAGMGGIGMGATSAGIMPIAHLEINPLSCQALTLNGASNVIQGDVCNIADVAKLHGAGSLRRTVISAGFPCQPYSTQGDMQGAKDSRSWTFLATLRAAWLMQAPAILLECVPAVQGHPFIRENLKLLADALGLQVKTLTLALQDQWPCRRDRWWALLAPREFDLTNLKPWAKDDLHSTIGHIIPDWPLWDNQVEEELQLTETELYHYNNHLFGWETRLLEQSGTCPTILHSYGSVFTKCPCGCRSAAFRPERLQRGGVRGCYVLSQTTGKPRFLHTAEAALLCTVPRRPVSSYGMDHGWSHKKPFSKIKAGKAPTHLSPSTPLPQLPQTSTLRSPSTSPTRPHQSRCPRERTCSKHTRPATSHPASLR